MRYAYCHELRPTDNKTLMNQQELQQLLVYKKRELCDRLANIQKDFSEEQVIDDVLFTLAHETKLELNRVKIALNDIEQGVYGKCEHCGGPVELERLQLNPFQSQCSSCDNEGK